MKKENILIFFGGKSAEHDISIITGLQVLKNIDKTKYNAFPIYIYRNGKMFFGKKLNDFNTYINFNEKNLKRVAFKTASGQILISGCNFYKKLKIDCAIICCHGLNGEDGSLQGLLELSDIPYTSSDILSCSICMDKIIMKDILKANNIKTPDYAYFNKSDYYLNEKNILKNLKDKLNLFNNSCFVKPSNLGSSIGIAKCNNIEELKDAIEIASGYDDRIIVEKSVEDAIEVNCAIVGNYDYQTVSDLEYPQSWSSFLNFDEKYIKGNRIKVKNKKKLSKELEQKIKDIAVNAYKIFNCSGVVRIDFLVDKVHDEVYLNELNSIPGSLAFHLFKKNKIEFDQLINKLIDFAKRKRSDKNNNKFSYESQALLNFCNNKNMNKYTKNEY